MELKTAADATLGEWAALEAARRRAEGRGAALEPEAAEASVSRGWMAPAREAN